MNNDRSAAGIENEAVDVTALERRIYDLRNLIEIGLSLSSNLDFKSLVESILYSCIGQLFVEKVSILLQVDIDIDNYYIHMAKGFHQPFEKDRVILTDTSPLVFHLERNPYPQDYDDLLKIQEIASEARLLDMLSPSLIVPMKSKNLLNGILVLGPKIHGGDFSAEEKDFIKDLGKFAATAVENSRLYRMATLDRMTRLYIHHYFEERLLEEIKRSERYGKPLSLLMTDIDHFKRFNDTYGHQQGDIVLRESARLFRDNLRKIDVPARYGGEEFAVILPESNMDDALIVAERLRKCIDEHGFPGQHEPLHVSISIGVAEYDMSRDGDRDGLIKRADTALYQAKGNGRNQVVLSR